MMFCTWRVAACEWVLCWRGVAGCARESPPSLPPSHTHTHAHQFLLLACLLPDDHHHHDHHCLCHWGWGLFSVGGPQVGGHKPRPPPNTQHVLLFQLHNTYALTPGGGELLHILFCRAVRYQHLVWRHAVGAQPAAAGRGGAAFMPVDEQVAGVFGPCVLALFSWNAPCAWAVVQRFRPGGLAAPPCLPGAGLDAGRYGHRARARLDRL